MTAPVRYRWQPTTAEIAVRFGLSESDVIRFDHNTSPYPTDWAPGIVAPMARHLNEYPGASYAPLRTAIAGYVNAEPENIVPGAGIDELITLIATTFLGPGTRATAAAPTYPLYEIATVGHHGEFIPVISADGWAFPADGINRTAQTSDVTWLCVPNNPTGERISDATIVEIIEKAKGIVVIDAAYAEFAGDRWADWVSTYENLIVLQTMSKAFGLAALRVGYSLASAELSARIDAVRPPGSIATLSERIATIAISEPSRMTRFVRHVTKERSRFADRLASVGIVAYPSTTNFLLCRVGPHAQSLSSSLLARGLVVRSYPADHLLADHLRFTVRSRKEDDLLVATIATLEGSITAG